jgi:MFS transporter, DHA1 family, tetracycline resistance protein
MDLLDFKKSITKSSFYLSLLVVFVDSMGIGLVYPVFSALFFDPAFFSSEVSQKVRGFYLGIHLSLTPLALFFSSPMWGTLSDSKGRKKPLQLSLGIAFFGYVTAICGVYWNCIFFLLASRMIIGVASGNMSVAQAVIADLSSSEEKIKNFGLYSMALGVGFAFGPFFGGILSSWSYSLPFFFVALLIVMNFILNWFFFQETHLSIVERKFNWMVGFTQIKKAFHFQGIRTIFLASFLHNFAWVYFYQFIPIYLMLQLQFSPSHVGCFYGLAGGVYALSAGILIRPFIRRFSSRTLFFFGNLLTGLGIIAIAFLPSSLGIWPLIVLICYFVAFVAPASTTLISNSASPQNQGEILSILTSVNTAAPVLSPLFSGLLVSTYPILPIWVGGSLMIIVSLLLLAVYRNYLFKF